MGGVASVRTVLAVLVLAAAGSVRAGAEEPLLRVRLLANAESVDLVAGGRSLRVEAAADGLRVDGRPVGSRHRMPPAGPYRVAHRPYRGEIEILRTEKGLEVINEIPLEAYVAATLLGEVSPSWGQQALRAQAVASRTYALHRRARAGDKPWHLEADTSAQVYLGIEGEAPWAWQATDATRGEYLAWRGEPILAAFHGTAGGRTASAAEVWGRTLPYLVSVEVPGEEASPDSRWRAWVSRGELEKIAAAMGRPVGSLAEVRVLAETPSGRVAEVALVGSDGQTRVSGRALRRALGATRLRSTRFRVRPEPTGFVFLGSGYGHGVGMSQWGARVLARRGVPYRRILAHFYPGTELRQLSALAPAAFPAAPAAGAR